MNFEQLNKKIGIFYRRVFNKSFGGAPLVFSNPSISKKSRVSCPKAMVLGNDVTISEHADINAVGGILIGSSVTVGGYSRINSYTDDYRSVIVLRDIIEYELVQGVSIVCDKKDDLLNIAKKELQSIDCTFILSAGRSGSKSIAHTLERHPQINAYHEPLRHFSELSKQKEEHSLPAEEWEEKLIFTLHTFLVCSKNKMCVLSDQKFGNLVSDIEKIMPNSKFIWLVRDPLKNIMSTVRRGWFSDAEMNFSNEQIIVSDPYYPHFRLNAYKCGLLSLTEWKAMSIVQRNVWYYKYWNELIGDQLRLMDKRRWMKVHLEELQNKIEEVLSFCKVKETKLDVQHVNNAKHKKIEDKVISEIKLELDRIQLEF